MKALLFDRFGGPEVLRYDEFPDPQPREGHAIVRTKAIGLNFADIYRRLGNYHLVGSPPWILGYEGAGVIEGTGQRVAFADSPHANAELVSVAESKLIPLPDDISFETAAAVLLQGLTAQYLIEDSYRVVSGTRALMHAASGGVGLMLVQLAKRAGAHVTALVSSEEKRVAAREVGADEVRLYGDSEWGNGYDVVYDSVGTTLGKSIDATRERGTIVFYGFSGGDPKAVDPRVLMDGSKTLTGGDLWSYLTSAEERRSRAARLFEAIRDGVKVTIARTFALHDGAEAHRFLESRKAIGKVLLIPPARPGE